MDQVAEVRFCRFGKAKPVVDVRGELVFLCAPLHDECLGVSRAQLELQDAAFGNVEVSFIPLLERGDSCVNRGLNLHLKVLEFWSGENREAQVQCRGSRGRHHQVHRLTDGPEAVAPPATWTAFHPETAFSSLYLNSRRHNGADRFDLKREVCSLDGHKPSHLNQSKVRNVEGFGSVVNEAVCGRFHRFWQGEVQPGKQQEGGKGILEVLPVFSKVDGRREAIGLEFLASLGDRRLQQLLTCDVFSFGAFLKLQGVEQPVFNLGEVPTNDPGRIVVVQSSLQADKPHYGKEDVPHRDPGHHGHEQVEQGCSGAGSEPPKCL